ncbi:ribosome-binding factor A [Nitrospira sp.]|nr:ribosome-binding factor A [Nitrospira sp.]
MPGRAVDMKPASKRATRVADQIRMEVADILMRKVRDPRVRDVTITDASVTNDLRLARVYYTSLINGHSDRELAEGLAKANGFIRSELGHRLGIRYTPELVFHRDVSGPRGDRILELLEQVRPEPDDQDGGGAAKPDRSGDTHGE